MQTGDKSFPKSSETGYGKATIGKRALEQNPSEILSQNGSQYCVSSVNMSTDDRTIWQKHLALLPQCTLLHFGWLKDWVLSKSKREKMNT